MRILTVQIETCWVGDELRTASGRLLGSFRPTKSPRARSPFKVYVTTPQEYVINEADCANREEAENIILVAWFGQEAVRV